MNKWITFATHLERPNGVQATSLQQRVVIPSVPHPQDSLSKAAGGEYKGIFLFSACRLRGDVEAKTDLGGWRLSHDQAGVTA